MNTNELIASLSKETPKPTLATPSYYGVRLIAILLVYGLGIQFALGLRADLAAQFSRPTFVLEIGLLALLTVCSARAAIVSMYPDLYQKHHLLTIPYVVFIVLLLFLLSQFFLPHDPMMVMPGPDAHSMECALCIASVSVIPSAIIFGLLRKGTSVYPARSGSFTIFAAYGIGCLTLRLSEANDSLMHLIGWHYLPTLFFATIGAWIGKKLLKW